MRVDKFSRMFLAMGIVLLMVGVASAEQVVIDASADTQITPRQNYSRYAANWGGTTIISMGHQGTDLDNLYDSLLRFDLSELAGLTAAGDGILTLKQETVNYGGDKRDFNGQTLDVYAMPLDNADWVEGTGSQANVPSVAWNRKKGDYSLTPPDADKWLPTASNNPEYGITKVASVTYNKATQGDADYVITIPQANINQWISDGVVSLALRSDSVIALGGTVRHFEAILTKEHGDGSKVSTLTIDAVPEPSTWVLIGMGAFGLLALARRRG